MKIPQNIQSEKNAHRIFQFSHKIARSGAPSTAQEAARAVASDPAGPQPRAMKFGHRFQQVIEQTHPSVSDQVRSRAARHPSGMAGDKKARHETLVRAAWRARRPRGAPVPPLPCLASRARSREMPRGYTLGRFPTRHPSVRRATRRALPAHSRR